MALIEPTHGPKEGLVVGVNDASGFMLSVEAKTGEYVGGREWMPWTAFYVLRDSFA